MEPKFIEDVIALMKRHGVAEFDYTDGETRIRLSFATAAPPAAPATAPPMPDTAEAEIENADAGNAAHEICATMAACFYRAPNPDAPPFVEVGSEFSEGDTLALLEAMKMLTPVEAETAGVIETIHAENGQMVARGDLLFTLKRAE